MRVSFLQSVRADSSLILIVSHLLLIATQTLAAESEVNITATVTSPVHPILIRNDHGPMLRVVLEVPEHSEAILQETTFLIEGLDEIESLGLYATDTDLAFTAKRIVGERLSPAKSITFPGPIMLAPGRNVFWLDCRLKATANLTGHVAATATRLVTNHGLVEPIPDGSPKRHRIGVGLRRAGDDGVHTYRIPALTTTRDGTLLCVYDMRRRMGRDLQEDIDIGLSRSTDGGQSWSPAQVILDMGEYGGLPQSENGCSDPGILVDHQTGDIFCFALWMNGKAGKHQWVGDGSEPGYEIGKSAQFMMVRSRDDGRTWSTPENLTRKLKPERWWLFAPAPQQGIQLEDGTLVMPSQGRDESGLEFSNIMLSRDHGSTWTVGTPAYRGGSECQTVQLDDGSLMLNMRNEHERFRAVSITKDFGKTWVPHETDRHALIEPNCNGSLLRFDYQEAGEKRHVLLFANPHTQNTRTHQTIQVSFDEGKTWPVSHHLLLDEGLGAGYPTLTQVDENHLGIVYEGSQAHLVFEKIPLKVLLNGSHP